MSGSVGDYPELDAATPPAPNLLQMGSQAVALRGQLNQNRLFAAQQAQGKYLTASTDASGNVNVGGFNAAMAADPNAQIGAGDAMAQAQGINQTLIANTGQTLAQHFTRLGALADMLQAENLKDNGAGVSQADAQNTTLEALKQGLITPSDAVNAYTSFTADPQKNAQLVRQYEAGIKNGLAAITPAYSAMSTGAGSITTQSNPGAAGGASMPQITTGMSAGQLAAPYQWTDANNQPHNGTVGEYLASQHVGTAPEVGGGVQPGNPTVQLGGVTTPGAPAGPSAPQSPLAQIGPAAAPPQAPGQAMPAMAQPGSAPGAPAPGQAPGVGGTPMAGPAPGLAAVQQQNADAYNADISAGSNLAPRISALQELAAAAPDAQTGPAAAQFADIRGLGAQLGINVGTDQASQEQVMNKATNLLVAAGVSGLGTPTDAKMLEIAGATPNAKMTPEAVKATVAMTYGSTLYQQNLANAAQQYVTQGGSPAKYNKWKLAYQQNSPSPLVLSMPYMPPQSLLSIGKYIKTLPASDQATIDRQISAMSAGSAQPQQ